MRIGLLRHFRVDLPEPGKCNTSEYDEMCRRYDLAGVIPNGLDLSDRGYSVCYASTLKRARDTAGLVMGNHGGKTDNVDIILSGDLVEIPQRALFNTRLHLPFKLWNVINRIGWLFNSKRAPETRKQSNQRAKRFLEQLTASNHRDVLIVSHGLFMVSLQIQLDKMGFKGQSFGRANYGHLYEFEK